MNSKALNILKGRYIKAFLFDLDRTVVNSSKAIADAVEHVLVTKGYSYSGQELATTTGMPLEATFHALVPAFSNHEIRQCVREYREYYSAHHLESTVLYPGVSSVLRNLKQHNFKLGIVTTKYRKSVLAVLKHFRLAELFDTVATGHETGRHKPAPDIVLFAAKRLEVHPSECVVVGDSPVDVEAGKRAGALTIAVLTGTSSRQDVKRAKPDFIIENLSSIPNLMTDSSRKRCAHSART